MSEQVTLIGTGGGLETLTREAENILCQSDAILGAARILHTLPDFCTRNRIAEVRPEALAQLLREHPWKHPCVVYGGDTGFYSGTRLLIPLLKELEIPCHVIPGVSSMQILSARLGRSWENWNLCSAHGMHCDAVAAVSCGKAAFFLTGKESPAALCAQLTAAGLGNLSVTVGENLGMPDERITRSTARKAADISFSPLSVLLAEPAPVPYPVRTPGIPDSDFIRGNVPMTKQEVRAVIPAKLAVRPGDTVWDVGAGTGSVSVELSRAAYHGRVYAVECNAEACELVRRNREKFGAWNLIPVSGTAPDILESLPVPDAVFIGGSHGKLTQIIDAVFDKNPSVRLCVSAITLETLSIAVNALTARNPHAEVCQIGITRTRPAGNLHLLTAHNPVFLITAQGQNTAGG